MKSSLLLFAGVLIFGYSAAQIDLPAVNIKKLSGEEISFRALGDIGDTALIVSFWATWCVPCIQELEVISEQYDERQNEIPFRLMAISVDDARTSPRVRPFVAGRGWPFEIYLDENSDLKRALNINDIPHVLIIRNGKILYQHNGYVAGNEETLFEKISSNQP